jgi:hypothetical protein
MCFLRLQYFFCTYNDIQKESYTITNINVWQLFPNTISTKPLQTALCNKYIQYTITFSLDKMFG